MINRYSIQSMHTNWLLQSFGTDNIFFSAAWYDTPNSLRDMLQFFLRVQNSHPYIEEQNELNQNIFYFTTCIKISLIKTQHSYYNKLDYPWPVGSN